MDFPWADTAPSPIAAAQDALQRMTTTVALASGLAASRRTVDLTGLDQAAGVLCARLLDLEPHQGTVLRPALMNLAGNVTALADTLRSQAPGSINQ